MIQVLSGDSILQNNMPDKNNFEEVSEWLETYHNSDDQLERTKAQSLIVTKMVPVVKRIARTIARRAYDPIEDLVQAGFIGLLKAIDNYSKQKNDNFRVYAGYLIIGEMKHYIRDKLNMIRVPAYIHELTIRIANFTRDLTQEEVQNLTSDEMATALDVSPKAVDLALEVDRRSSTISLDGLASNTDQQLSYEEILSSDDYKEQSEFEDSKIIFNEIIEKLPPEKQVVIDLYYNQDMNKTQIADALQITTRRVTKIMKEAYGIISDLINEKKAEAFNNKER